MFSGKAVSLLFFVFLFPPSEQSHTNLDRIRLKDVDHITFAIEKNVTSRRGIEPVSQLECIGGTNECKWIPEVINCSNRGFDRSGKTVLWGCSGDQVHSSLLRKIQVVKFNQTLVTCEGYDSVSDEYISLQSCRLQYSIDTIDGHLHYNSFWRRVKDQWIIYSICLIIIIVLVVFCVFAGSSSNGDYLFLPVIAIGDLLTVEVGD